MRVSTAKISPSQNYKNAQNFVREVAVPYEPPGIGIPLAVQMNPSTTYEKNTLKRIQELFEPGHYMWVRVIQKREEHTPLASGYSAKKNVVWYPLFFTLDSFRRVYPDAEVYQTFGEVVEHGGCWWMSKEGHIIPVLAISYNERQDVFAISIPGRQFNIRRKAMYITQSHEIHARSSLNINQRLVCKAIQGGMSVLQAVLMFGESKSCKMAYDAGALAVAESIALRYISYDFVLTYLFVECKMAATLKAELERMGVNSSSLAKRLVDLLDDKTERTQLRLHALQTITSALADTKPEATFTLEARMEGNASLVESMRQKMLGQNVSQSTDAVAVDEYIEEAVVEESIERES